VANGEEKQGLVCSVGVEKGMPCVVTLEIGTLITKLGLLRIRNLLLTN
jgi:hypothetical protein